jgi:putative SOS response-associated peptidase YedK
MCGRITQEQKALERQFRKELKDSLKPAKEFNIGIGEFAIVIDSSGEWRQIKFGFNRDGRLNFNARAEGFHNKNNEVEYSGKLGIHTNPIYSDILLTSRCLIPVSSFLEGPEKERLSKPFKLSLNYVDAFMLAGVIGIDEKTGNEGFSILTCWPNQIISEVVGHHRSPVIIDNPDYYQTWLDNQTEIDEVLSLLHPVDNGDLDIHELNPKYKSAKFAEPY